MDKKQKQLIQLGVTGKEEDRIIFLLDMSKGVITFGYEYALLDIFGKKDVGIGIVRLEDGAEPFYIGSMKPKEVPLYIYADKAIIITKYSGHNNINNIKMECSLIKIDETIMSKASDTTGIACKGAVPANVESLWEEYKRNTKEYLYIRLHSLKVVSAHQYIKKYIGVYLSRYRWLILKDNRQVAAEQKRCVNLVERSSNADCRSYDSEKGSADSSEEGIVSSERSLDSSERSLDSSERSPDSSEESIVSSERSLDSSERSLDSSERSLDSSERSLDSSERSLDSETGKSEKEEYSINSGSKSKESTVTDNEKNCKHENELNDNAIKKESYASDEYDEQADFISDTFGVENENSRKAERKENDRKLEEASRELLKLADSECSLCNGSGLMAGKFGTKTICRCIKEKQKKLLDEKALEEQSSKPVYHATLGDRNNITALKLVPEEHKDAEFEMNRLIGKGGKLELLSIMHKSTVIDNGYIKGLSEILSAIQFRNKLKHSYLISAPNGYSKTTFVYTCIRLLYLSGKKAVPYISILQLMELLSDYISEHSIFDSGENESKENDEENISYKWKDYLNADIAFVELTANGFETVEGQMLKTLLSERGRRSLPTIAVTERAFNRYVNTEEQKKLWANMVTTSICNAEYDRMVYIRAYELMQAAKDGKYILELGNDRSFKDAM